MTRVGSKVTEEAPVFNLSTDSSLRIQKNSDKLFKKITGKKKSKEDEEKGIVWRFLFWEPFWDSNGGEWEIGEEAEKTERKCKKISRIHEQISVLGMPTESKHNGTE